MDQRSAGPRAPLRAALLLSVLLFPMLLGIAAPAAAHRLKEALTTVEVNARSGLVEVVHRFWMHDAEHAVGELVAVNGDLRQDPALRDIFADYVARHFVLADADRAPVPLTLIGVELEGPYLWVYQEMAADEFETLAFVANGALQEIWSDQINQINLKRDGIVRSYRIRARDGLVRIDVDDFGGEEAAATGP